LKDGFGNIVYVGITMQDPQKRCGKVLTQMDVIATYTGPSKAVNRQQARSTEGSCLNNIGTGSHGLGQPTVTAPPTPPGALQNATKNNGMYYHSYVPWRAQYQAPVAGRFVQCCQ
jgi:hypothetical protein